MHVQTNLYNNLWKLEEASLLKMPTGLTSTANMFDKVRVMMCSTFSISIGVSISSSCCVFSFLEKG